MTLAVAAVSPEHERNAELAKLAYLACRDPLISRGDWQKALREARRTVASALRSSRGLYALADALAVSGSHMTAFRHLLAPPCSQDQFKLLCPDWRKSTEKSGAAISSDEARAIAVVLERWLDPAAAPWVGEGA